VAIYLIMSLINGEEAGNNPWHATGLEWTTQSPPLPHNFETIPVVTEAPYEYSKRELEVV
jgi:cytochrome c oxidase subunit 1